MTRILPLICFLILTDLASYSQDSAVAIQKGQVVKYRKGYIITSTDDTIRGSIYHKNDSTILFIREDKTVKSLVVGNFSSIPYFTAGDGKIKAFYRNGISYTVGRIPPDGRKVFLAVLEAGRIMLYGLIYNYSDKVTSDQVVSMGFVGSLANADNKSEEEYYNIKYYMRKLPGETLVDPPKGERRFREVFFPLIRDNPAFVRSLPNQPADYYHVRNLVKQYNGSWGK